MVDNSRIFVRLQRRRNRKIGSCVTIEDVHQLGLFHPRYRQAPSFGVGGEILARNDTSRTGLSIRLLLHLHEAPDVGVVV